MKQGLRHGENILVPVAATSGKKGTRLYKVANFMGTRRTEYCMTMTCPSTGRVYIEWTPPAVGKKGDAELCQAEAFGIPLEDWLLIEQEA